MKHRPDCAPVSLPCDCGADLSTLLTELDAAYATATGPISAENERLRAERDQLSEIIDTWGFAWMEERENNSWHQSWRQAVRERDEARRECDEARARAIRWNNEHATAEDRWVEERDALRTERDRLHRLVCDARAYIDPEKHAGWEADASAEAESCETRHERLRTLVEQQREALLGLLDYAGRNNPDDACENARAVLAAEVPS